MEPTIKPTIKPTTKPTIKPTIKLSRAPIAAKTKSTPKFLTIPESRIWHRRLAHRTLLPWNLLLMDIHMMILCVQSASKPSTSNGLLECQSSALWSPLNMYTLMCVAPFLHQSSETIDIIYYSSTTIQGTHPYGCSPTRMLRPAPPPTSHFRPE